jgi:hypothetical protein
MEKIMLLVLIMTAMSGFLCCPCGAAADESARTPAMSVSLFGATGDGLTDDGPALRRALADAAEASAKSNGQVLLRFEPGKTYRVGPWDEQWCTLPVLNAHGLVIEGNGAELVFHPKNRAFLLEGCEGVVIRDLKMDYNPLPFTQGDVVSVDHEAKTFVFRLHEGYAEPPDMAWVLANGQTFDHGSFIEAAPSDLFTHRWIYVESVTPVPDSPGMYTIVSGARTQDQMEEGKVAAGQRFAFYLPHPSAGETGSRDIIDENGVWSSRQTASIQVIDSTACVFEDIDLYTSPRMGLFMAGCSDVALRRFRIIRRPGTDRLISTVSDGMHGWCRRGPVIEDCDFDGSMDDSLGFQQIAHVVTEKLADGRLRIEYRDIAWHDTRLREGDVVQAWDPVKGILLGERRIAEMEFVSSHVRVITLDKPLDGIRDFANDLAGDPAHRNQATQLYLKNESPMVVRDSRFGTQLKEAMRICYSATIEGNVIENSAYGIQCSNNPAWWTGPHPQDLVYRNNRISGAWPFAIGAMAFCHEGEMQAVRGGVIIENNEISMMAREWGSQLETGIRLENLSCVVLRNNTIAIGGGIDPGIPAIKIRNCPGIILEGNTVNDGRATATCDLVLIE